MDIDLSKINLIPALIQGYKEDFNNNLNIIGSEIAFGMRSNIIIKKHNLNLSFKNELLAGKILHRGFQKKEAIYEITKEINKQLGYNEKEINGFRFIKLKNNNYQLFEALSEYQYKKKYPKNEYIEVFPNKFFRMHPDIWTSLYCIELKTTSLPKKMWKDIAPYYIMQLNSYLGFHNHKFGFLLRCDLGFTGLDFSRTGFFKSKSTKSGYLWNNYFLLYPHYFNEKLFQITLNRISMFFKYIKNHENLRDIPCPEFPEFECEGKCKKYCPNPITKVKMEKNDICSHCGKTIFIGTTAFMRNNKLFHYTGRNRERIEDCIKACKEDYHGKI